MLNRETLETAMRRALELARRGAEDDPNPRVGCVILDPAGRSVAEGWHHGAGTAHAEVEALAALPEAWRGRERELTAVVTLEPCNHTGRTGPCAVALADAKVGAVAFALKDPSPVAGGGTETLRAAGVEVTGGVLADEARELLASWLARQAEPRSQAPQGAKLYETSEKARNIAEKQASFAGLASSREGGASGNGDASARGDADLNSGAGAGATRPHITMKWAQTLDGRAAAADGSSQWITGAEARADVHRRRAEADAILVGTGTLYADDPALTARGTDGELLVPAAEQPIPVVLGRREVPADARISTHPALGAHNLSAPLHFSGEDLAAHLAELSARGVRRLFIEGGPTVASAFIAAGFADELLVYVAPALLGGPRLALGDLGIETMAGIKRLRISEVTQLGDDLLIRATTPPQREGH